MAEKSPICQFCNKRMVTLHKTAATIALDSRLGLQNQPYAQYAPSLLRSIP